MKRQFMKCGFSVILCCLLIGLAAIVNKVSAASSTSASLAAYYKSIAISSINVSGKMRLTTPVGTITGDYYKVGQSAVLAVSAPNANSGRNRMGMRMPMGMGMAKMGFYSKIDPVSLVTDRSLRLILDNYNITDGKRGNYLGRNFVELIFVSKSDGDARRKVWLDSESGIELLREDYNGSGKLIEKRELLTFQVIPGNMAQNAIGLINRCKQRMFAAIPLNAAVKAHMPQFLPPGYQFVGYETGPETGTVHVVFSNGIGFISLYQKNLAWWQRNTTQPAQNDIIIWDRGNVQLTLLGDCSTTLLYKIATSIP